MYFDWELAFLNFLYAHHMPFLDWLMKWVSFLGNAGWFWIVLTVILLMLPRYRDTGIKMAAALILCLLVGNVVLKPLIARVRPYDVSTMIELLIERLDDYSFPSGHTYSSFAAACVLVRQSRRLGIPALIVAFLIAFSRLYLYVHYPTDVIAGMLLGAATASFSVWLVDRVRTGRYRRI